MIQLIDKQKKIFRVKQTEFQYKKLDVYLGNDFIPLPKVVKGSTLGWNIKGAFVSYNQIKKKLNETSINKLLTT